MENIESKFKLGKYIGRLDTETNYIELFMIVRISKVNGAIYYNLKSLESGEIDGVFEGAIDDSDRLKYQYKSI